MTENRDDFHRIMDSILGTEPKSASGSTKASGHIPHEPFVPVSNKKSNDYGVLGKPLGEVAKSRKDKLFFGSSDD